MQSGEIRSKFLKFFESRGHAIIPSASLVPENDPSVLFTTAGMQPLVPYLLGQKHPSGTRLASVQKCVRTGDIEEIGDEVHHSFFEMLGNWSLGDYFKKDAIEFSFEFLTKILKIPKDRLAVSVFEGDENAPKDNESAEIWKSLGISEDRIAFLSKEDNWWGPAGLTGPSGPSTEMFYWKLNDKLAPKKFNSDDDNWVEIWNDVLMQYNKDKNGNYTDAKQKNIDTGMGVERTVAILEGFEDNYLADMWKPIIEKIELLSKHKYDEDEKITATLVKKELKTQIEYLLNEKEDKEEAKTFIDADKSIKDFEKAIKDLKATLKEKQAKLALKLIIKRYGTEDEKADSNKLLKTTNAEIEK